MRKTNSNRRQFLKRGAVMAAATIGASPFLPGARKEQQDPTREWQHYGGNPGATRYSPLDQINRSNVRRLKVAWVHRTGDASVQPPTTIGCEPKVINGVMYVLTATSQVRALDAATGTPKWTFSPPSSGRRVGRGGNNSRRGVTFWLNPNDSKDQRIFAPDTDWLHGLNATTGRPNPGFANEGVLDLVPGYDPDRPPLQVSLTTPPAVYGDLIIVGGGVGEGPGQSAAGHIRAFDANTGKLRWIFHTIPKPGEFGHDTWSGDSWKLAGGANNWGGMSVDVKRGWVFASTGSPAFDFYGGDRKGANLFGNCVLALNAKTGARLWHFQTTHHDVWDYDNPSAPSLITVRQRGRRFDAVLQMTKTGLTFLFDRVTGKPVFAVEERPTPPSDIPGEELWPTQPFPVKPPPLNRLDFTEADVTDLSPEAHEAVMAIVRNARYGRIYTPPALLQDTLMHPGFRGGVEWGGASFDPKLNRVFVNSDESVNRLRLAPAPPNAGFPYTVRERGALRDPEGYPAIKPPWGYMTAIDLESGNFAWRVVHGEFEALKARGIPKTGALSTGSSVATAGGLVFIASSYDEKFRAFDSASGELLWEYVLPAAGFASPCTYEVDGRQYITIACGGGKNLTRPGDQFLTFSL